MNNKKHKKRKWLSSKKTGLPPGSLVYVGNRENLATTCKVYDYNAENIQELQISDLDQIATYRDSNRITWINVTGLSDPQAVSKIGQAFGLHDLLIEDILNTTGRPKLEEDEQRLFAILKMVWHEGDILHFEHVSLVLGKNWVLSFQEMEGDVFGSVRERLKNKNSRLRTRTADYLFYALLDSIVDNYFVVLEHVGDQLENCELELLSAFEHEQLVKLQVFRKELIRLRRSVYPLREVINGLTKIDNNLVNLEHEKYFRDLYDHSVQVIETVETYRDLLTTILDIYMSGVSNRMNNVMKVLTIIATIFIPLTFIVGVYGMNFDNMPELHWQYGYFYVLAFMTVLALGMLAAFKRKGWL